MKKHLSIFVILCLFTALFAPHSSYAEANTEFSGLNDPDLLPYIEDVIYDSLITELQDTDYIIERVEAKYISQEYIDEVAYNSRANIYFGYTLAELNEQFEGTRYVFTLGDDNQTTVIPFEEYVTESIYTKIIKNVAIGAGVILVCVVISSATAVSAPAISMIFSFAAGTGKVFAVTGSKWGFITSGVVHYIQTGDLKESFEYGLLGASDGFKWGAIGGSVTGATMETSLLFTLRKKLDYLDLNEVSIIQRDSRYSLEFLEKVRNFDEYNVYKDAGLIEYRIGKQRLLLPDDFDFSIINPKTGETNLQAMLHGRNPVDLLGKTYEWHHVGQKVDSPLALLTHDQHSLNYSILHDRTIPGVDHGSTWERQKNWTNKIVAEFFS